MNRIKNIIFDLGGVLLDLDVHRCLERLENIGLHEVRQWMTGTNEKGLFKEYECGTLTTEQFSGTGFAKRWVVNFRTRRLTGYGTAC